MNHIFFTKITAEIKFDKQANVYVAHVPVLKIYSQDETLRQAEKAIMDAVESFLAVSHKANKEESK